MRTQYLLAFIIALPTLAMAANDLKTLQQKASYGFGANYARQLKSQGVNLDIDAFTRGIKDASEGRDMAINEDDMKKTMAEFQTQIRAEMQKKQAAAGEKNLAEGKAFLAKNAKEKGVITTKSGLQYKVITSGSGEIPTADDTVITHYKGTLIDGREFDSSYKRGQPATFPVLGVIKGWTEALQLMRVGDKWELFIPSNLAYGPSTRSELIQANSALIFELELLEIKSKKK